MRYSGKPLLIVLAGFLLSLVSARAASACELSEPEIATVAAIIDGETLKLTDGRNVRLIGAKAPMPPLGWRATIPRHSSRKPSKASEREARTKRLGLWSSSAYRIVKALDLDRLGRLIHSYQLVEGKVAAVGEGGGRLYLNFAQDWRRDFTISIERKDLRHFAAAGIELKALAGRDLRVRGTLAWRNGPMIEASHPEQIELLPERPLPQEM